MTSARAVKLLLFGALALAAISLLRASSAPMRSAIGLSTHDAPHRVGTEGRDVREGVSTSFAKEPQTSLNSEDRPKSLRDTDIDGELHIDAQGRFQADPAALRLFEYFLSARGELEEEALRARIIAEVEARLPPSARVEAIRLLDDYLAYRARADELGPVSADPEDLHAAIDTLYAMRREVFGEKRAEALFGDEERARTAALERRLIAGDRTLNASEKAARMAELEKDLPESLRQARQHAQAPVLLRDQTAKMRAEGATDETVFAVREEALGRDAAQRLKALDERRAVFAQKLEAVRNERARIFEDRALSPSQKTSAIEGLIARSFQGTELLRARALLK